MELDMASLKRASDNFAMNMQAKHEKAILEAYSKRGKDFNSIPSGATISAKAIMEISKTKPFLRSFGKSVFNRAISLVEEKQF